MLYGVKTPAVRKIATEYFEIIKEKSKAEIFEVCEALWQSGYLEESIIACIWSDDVHERYQEEDLVYPWRTPVCRPSKKGMLAPATPTASPALDASIS